ncbi:hypothetical protein ACFL0U_01305 [Pseudomonadota bacterium]
MILLLCRRSIIGIISEDIKIWTDKQSKFSSAYNELVKFLKENNIEIKTTKNPGNLSR